MSEHVSDAFQYMEDVISGDLIACKYIIQACNRQLRDLKRQKSRSFPYYFDPYAAERAVNFIEKMPHIKGEWAKKRMKLRLEPWQKFLVTCIFGWRVSRDIFDDEGELLMQAHTRRFRTVYLEVARKNAKSTLLSAIGLYMSVCDGEEGAEVYSAATTHKQAKIVWEDARKMAQKSAGFRNHFGVSTNAKNINVADSSSKFEPLHSQGETLDGLNVHCGIMDELHAHKKRELWDVVETATGSRSQPLMIAITTAGTNKAGICYEQRTYLIKVLAGLFEDESYFGLIYTLDFNMPDCEDDDPLDRKVWRKANPNYGVSVYPMDMERLARKAAESPASMNNFLTKRLNIWCNAEASWMNMIAWDKCANPDLDEADFVDDKCWIGVDLASKIDINAVVRLYKREIKGETHVYCFPDFYLPELAIEEGANSQYDGWKRRKLLIETPGNIIDMDKIESDIVMHANKIFLQECCFDPGHNSTQWAAHLEDEGVDMVEIRPTVMNFSEPMKWMEGLVLDGRFHHQGNAIMDWMISNVVVKHDLKDNIYPRKERIENKIDGPVAICIAMNRLLADEADTDPTVLVV